MSDKLVQKLIEIYQKAKQDLVKTIAEKEAIGNLVTYQKSLLFQVNQILSELTSQAYNLTNEIVESYYKDTIDEVLQDLKDKGEQIQATGFSKLHTGAIAVIAKNFFQDLQDANNFVGRQISDAIRKAGLDAVSQKIATGQTVQECKKNLVNMLIDQGFNGIKDKRGRMISLDAYASTVARSTTTETTNTATTNQLTELGYDLVQMTEHSPTCAICALYQGRVYSISGKDTRFPSLSVAFNGEFANIHPNCAHRLFPYIESLADNFDKDIEFSNRPFELSEKDKKVLETYNNQQKEKIKLRNDRDQWQRYKLAMPQDTPKNFASFRRNKNLNNNKYQNLLSSYRSLRQGGEGD
ncbi:phage minor capsid protein [Clostridium pasteurianum]|uniref:Phage minor capsid protein 2 n=1 Tax=Clostridium pasteurianum BC1 TaxID=86416 RepID=R4K8Y8_CLOPA|nr:phage minor capsid protein [Clostridium pasteurianum]AGK98176.1 Phage minor capsid protein 2 [Clostridium pasteurianum BC1]